MYLTNYCKNLVVNLLNTTANKIALLGQNESTIVLLSFDNDTVKKEVNSSRLIITIDIPTTDQRISSLLPFTVHGVSLNSDNEKLVVESFVAPKEVNSSHSGLVISWIIEV